MSADLIVLGIDAANPDLVRQWADDGKLPNLARCFDAGFSGPVAGVAGYYIGSTWQSFSTGLNPAGHGFHRIVQLRDSSYEFFRPLDEPAAVAGTPFWSRASEAGKRVAVLDVPLTRLSDDLNGVQIVEWGGHDSVFGFRTNPPELAGRILDLVGEYPLPPNCDDDRPAPADFRRFVEGLETAVDSRTQITLDLLDREPWDLFVQVFTESHCVGHQCWHLHDATHPAHEEQLRAELGDPVERVYRSIDRGVGQILDAAGDATVVIVAAHGMSYFRGAGMLLPEILVRLGVTQRRPRRRRSLPRLARAAFQRAVRLGGSDRPKRAVVGPGSLPGVRMPKLRFDTTTSKCFPVANGHPVGAIRLNLAGREATGVLQPGDTEGFIESLRQSLLAIVDERTGRPLISDVTRTASLYDGPRLGSLPDILVTWNDELPTGTTAHGGGAGATITATSAAIGTVTGTNSYVRTGDHTAGGWFAAFGDGIDPGRAAQPVSVMDFHPTLCRLMGIEGQLVDGTIIEAIT